MGIRVIKTAVAAVIAVWLATSLDLQYAMSAGLLAILGVESTIRKGVVSSLTRLAASVLGLFLAAVMLQLFGFQLWLVPAYILLIIPILNAARLTDGLATCSVTVFHLFMLGHANLEVLSNELLLLLTGLGTATLINMVYMPSAEQRLLELRTRTDGLLSTIFGEIAKHLQDHDYVWDGRELLEARETIRQGAEVARRAAENRLFQSDLYWNAYFQMRDQQLDYVEQMMDLMAQVYMTLPPGRLIAQLFEVLSEDVKEEIYTGNSERLLTDLVAQYKEMPLPSTRSEFEVRSALFQVTQLLQLYLTIAKKEKKRRGKAPRL
ncbi:aromatic acid exporter family protein [Paenibacillus sp. HJGM_3]|uniref:aromatic acid exporter family protein n=1 Tax=Paenibacillus sp. HJGM_3 TaxID=3379816 RepID=UPI00385C10FB